MKRRKPAQLTPRKRKKPEPVVIREAVFKDGAWVFEVPTKTVSEMNRIEHWGAKRRRAKSQRELAKLCCDVALPSPVARSIRFSTHEIKLLRVGGKRMDDDNLASAMKHVRDGIADSVQVDDGSNRIKWRYDQLPDGSHKSSVFVYVREIEWEREEQTK